MRRAYEGMEEPHNGVDPGVGPSFAGGAVLPQEVLVVMAVGVQPKKEALTSSTLVNGDGLSSL